MASKNSEEDATSEQMEVLERLVVDFDELSKDAEMNLALKSVIYVRQRNFGMLRDEQPQSSKNGHWPFSICFTTRRD